MEPVDPEVPYEERSRDELFLAELEETVVRFTPWSGGEQSTLLKLSEKYGDRLVGLFKTPYSDLEVYVDEVAG